MIEMDPATDDSAWLATCVNDAVEVIRSRCDAPPVAGIILGTGLGSLADQIDVEAEWPYSALPHFARSTADGHRGRLLFGRLNDVPVVALDGRFHRYEGYSFEQVTFPVRVLSALSVRLLIVSNASGGLNPALNPGDIVLIDDHINLMWPKPGGSRSRETSVCSRMSTSPNSHEFGDESQSDGALYDPRLLDLAERAAADEQIALRRGTYIAMLGPNYETRAEYRWLRSLGDVVGMSTVPELLVAAELQLPAIAFSIVANVFRPAAPAEKTTSSDVQDAVATTAPKLQRLVSRLVESHCSSPKS